MLLPSARAHRPPTNLLCCFSHDKLFLDILRNCVWSDFVRNRHYEIPFQMSWNIFGNILFLLIISSDLVKLNCVKRNRNGVKKIFFLQFLAFKNPYEQESKMVVKLGNSMVQIYSDYPKDDFHLETKASHRGRSLYILRNLDYYYPLMLSRNHFISQRHITKSIINLVLNIICKEV